MIATTLGKEPFSTINCMGSVKYTVLSQCSIGIMYASKGQRFETEYRCGEWHGKRTEFISGCVINSTYLNGVMTSTRKNQRNKPEKAFYFEGKSVNALHPKWKNFV